MVIMDAQGDSSDKVAVIIPTYNRFSYLMNAIKSIQAQTHKNIEIIVINDCSTQPEYYTHDWVGVKIIHLCVNSRKLFGYACCGFVRNQGIWLSNSKYVAFCDDDDIWFPNKIELQLAAMKRTGCKMSSTEGLIGHGVYETGVTYKKYNGEANYDTLQYIYKMNGSDFLVNGFPDIWDYDFIKIHNCVIISSVLMEREVLEKIGDFNNVRTGQEDWDCWLRTLKHTRSVYVKDVCFYYDHDHGAGRNY